jgi:hypothetical protein
MCLQLPLLQQLSELYLGQNYVSCGSGVSALSSYLETNCTLKVLHINNNSLTDVGCAAISSALASNTTLRSINMYGKYSTERQPRADSIYQRRECDHEGWGSRDGRGFDGRKQQSGVDIDGAVAQQLCSGILLSLQGHNPLGDDGSRALATGVRRSRQLKELLEPLCLLGPIMRT